LGPQLMVSGGGRETTAWYGMAYAGQIGKRVPVPLIQAFDCLVIYAILLLVEARYRLRANGFMIATAATLYGLARFFEENVFLRQNDHVGGILVQSTGVALVVIGATWMMFLARRAPASPGPAGQPRPPEQQLVKVLSSAEAAAADATPEVAAGEEDLAPLEPLLEEDVLLPGPEVAPGNDALPPGREVALGKRSEAALGKGTSEPDGSLAQPPAEERAEETAEVLALRPSPEDAPAPGAAAGSAPEPTPQPTLEPGSAVAPDPGSEPADPAGG
ncbi:MAG: prolipoprotein diacylglyceryl transferase family protein, partial [Actinomycetota bacterium]